MFNVLLPSFKDKKYNVLDFGAKPSSLENSGEAINKAIDICSKDGGGYVIIPKGIYYSSPIYMKDDVCLYFETGALVKMIKKEEYYPLYETEWEGIKRIRCVSPIMAIGCKNIGICGKGFFDGSGDLWRPTKDWKLIKKEWEKRVKKSNTVSVLKESSVWYPNERIMEATALGEGKVIPNKEKYWDYFRPVMVAIHNCDRVLLEGMTFSNSPAWNIHPMYTTNLTVKGCVVKNPFHAQNGDGIDVESCKNVEIADTSFEVGDDGICIKSGKNREARAIKYPCENVYIHGCNVFEAHGGFVVGSEMSRGVSNILVENCNFIGTDVGIRFKSALGRGGVVSDITIKDIRMTNIKEEAIIFTMSYALTTIGVAGCEETRNDDPEDIPYFDGIMMENIFCDSSKKSFVCEGYNKDTIKNITLKNSYIDGTIPMKLTKCSNITFDNTTFNINGDVKLYNDSYTVEE